MKKQLIQALIVSLTLTRSYGQSLIKYDPSNKTLPFDQAFILQVDSVKTGDISSISVYEVRYIHGHGKLVDRKQLKGVFGRPNFTLRSPAGFTQSGLALKIYMPAIKPERDFDLLIHAQFSKEHLKLAMQINQMLYNNHSLSDAELLARPDIVMKYRELYYSVNQSPYTMTPSSVVFNYDLPQYRAMIFPLVEPRYRNIINNSNNFYITNTIPQNRIDSIRLSIPAKLWLGYRLESLQNIVSDSTINSVFNGLLPATYSLPITPADPFDFEQRQNNLNSTIHYIDSLDEVLTLIRSHLPETYTFFRSELRHWVAKLDSNRAYIKGQYDSITRSILAVGREGVWLAQSTISSDLKTASTRHFTVDVGLTNIGAYDNKNDYKNMQKLFFGLNYHFISIDKNVDFRRIPKPEVDGDAHDLESRNSIWQRLSLTMGFVLGAMQNKDFDNVYNNLSFTLGPSVRIGKIIRLSGGGAMIKRFDTEPLYSKSRIAIANYISVSLDYDLLSAVSNVTSMIFK